MKRGLKRRARKLLVALSICLLAGLCLFASQVCAQDPSKYSLKKISSVAVSSRGDGSATVFVADASSGIVFAQSIGTDGSVPLSEFKPFFLSSLYKQPVSIATYHNVLYVCDSSVPALVSIDLNSHKLTPIIEGPPLHTPSSMAIASDGTIAVIDSADGSIAWVLPGNTVIRNIKSIVQQPGTVAFYRKRLLIEDLSTNSLLSIPVPLNSSGKTTYSNPEPYQKSSSEVSGWKMPKPLDDFRGTNRVAVTNGILYLSDGRDIIAMEDENAVPLPVTLAAYPFKSATAVVATGSSLFVADSKGESVWRIPLVVPALVDFQVDKNIPELNRSLSEFYTYLSLKGVLSLETVRTDKEYSSLWDFLVSRGLFVPSKCCGADVAEQELSALLFQLNTQAFVNSPVKLRDKLAPGIELNVPKVEAKRRLGSVGVRVQNEAISAEVKSRVASEDLLRRINADYIAKINSVLPRDVETLLNKMGLSLANPPSEYLKPGTILELGKFGSFQVIGTLGQCGTDIATSSAAVSFPQVIGAPVTTLPAYKNSISTSTYKTASSTVQMDVNEATLETIREPEVMQFLTSSKGHDCAKMISNRKAYIISNALKISGVEFRLVENPGRSSASSLWESAGKTGYFKSKDSKTLSTNIPFYLAVALIKIENGHVLPGPRVKTRGDWGSFGSIDAAFGGVEQINLPEEQWTVRVNVPAVDLRDEKSPLYKFTGLDVVSTEDLNANATGYGVALDEQPTTIQVAQANRKKLEDEIHFDPSLLPADLSLTIGLAESADSVDMQHPAFWSADKKSAWHVVDSNLAIQTVAPQAQTETEILDPSVFQKTDHGTHTAGLLASRNGKLGPGLVAKANLLLIDTTSAASLKQSLTAAINNQVYVFSFSFDVERGSSWTALKNQVQNKAKDRLFIVAAGDDGQDVKDLEIAPIGWVGEGVPNIIGVAAADWDKQILGEYFDSSGVKQPGSNFGAKFVQLAAPGKDIYSTIKGGGYGMATGSSQAVPQVAATAAILISESVTDPLVLKQRLLYTADWYKPNFVTKLWGGGLLNIQRAVWQPHSNLLWTQSDKTHVRAVSLGEGTIAVQSAETDEPDGLANTVTNKDLNFKDILRVTLEKSGKFRVIYQESGKMRVLNEAMLDGFVPCESVWNWNNDRKVFEQDSSNCSTTFPVKQIFDYVSAAPKSAK